MPLIRSAPHRSAAAGRGRRCKDQVCPRASVVLNSLRASVLASSLAPCRSSAPKARALTVVQRDAADRDAGDAGADDHRRIGDALVDAVDPCVQGELVLAAGRAGRQGAEGEGAPREAPRGTGANRRSCLKMLESYRTKPVHCATHQARQPWNLLQPLQPCISLQVTEGRCACAAAANASRSSAAAWALRGPAPRDRAGGIVAAVRRAWGWLEAWVSLVDNAMLRESRAVWAGSVLILVCSTVETLRSMRSGLQGTGCNS